MYRATHELPIAATPARLFSLLEDYETFTDYMPDYQEVRVDQVVNRRFWVSFQQALLRLKLRYTLILEHKSPSQIQWSLAHSEQLRVHSGAWDLVPIDSASSRVVLHTQIELSQWIPDTMFSRILDGFWERQLHALKSRAEETCIR